MKDFISCGVCVISAGLAVLIITVLVVLIVNELKTKP